MDEVDRYALSVRLRAETDARFEGKKKAAYTAAGVNAATWERAINGESIKPHIQHRIISSLWPATNGDFDLVPPATVGGATQDERSYVESPGDRAEGSASDDEVLRAIHQMQEDIRAMSERLARFAQDRSAEPVDRSRSSQ